MSGVIRFQTTAIFWRGPAPFVFAAIPQEPSDEIRALSRELTYGWGVIPVVVTVGRTTWSTSLFPRDGLYLVPLKKAVQTAEGIEVGKPVQLEVRLG